MYVFFDLDGTLTDPREGILACLHHALASLDIEIDENLDLESFIGPPLHETFRYLCGDDSLAEQAIRIYRERYSSTGLYENRLYEGIEACLEGLAGKTCAKYVVTSKLTGFSQRIVEHFGIDRHFKVVYGSNFDGSLGDKTDLLAHVLDSEGVESEDCVMIGDRKFDMIGAGNHGIRSIGVLWGFGSEQELLEAGAGSICENPLELNDHLFA